jgi:arylsulfatase
MAQLFSGQDGERQQAIYWEHEGNCAVRQGDWKLVREFGQDWELYNMKEDRTELENLRHKDSQLANNLSEDFNAWAEQVGVVDWEIQRNNPNMNWVKDGK